jgi:hypothetical protein
MVVMKGPVATAGSILNLFKTNGITVPKKDAKIITINNEMETEKARLMLFAVKKL